MRLRGVITAIAMISFVASGNAAEVADIITALKSGGHIIVFRHGITDWTQRDIYPFKFDDMAAQRQLNEQGRSVAREIGTAFKKQGIPIGTVFTSRLNRAVETGRLISGKEVTVTDALTESAAGSSSAFRELRAQALPPATNIMMVTYKTNIAEAFGKNFSDIREGEAIILKRTPGDPETVVGRIQPSEWLPDR